MSQRKPNGAYRLAVRYKITHSGGSRGQWWVWARFSFSFALVALAWSPAFSLRASF